MAFLIKRNIKLSEKDPKINDEVHPEKESVVCYHLDADRDEELGFPLAQYNLNYLFDKPDPRDFLFKSTLLRNIDPAQLPVKVDLRPSWGDILDQGSLGSCVANSVVYQLRYVLKKNTGKILDMSRLFIYYNGRLLSNFPLNEDTGLSMRNGFQSVATYGTLPEVQWPYNISKFSTRAPDELYKNALTNKYVKYYAVSQDINELKKCLKDGFGISFGMALFSSFMTTNVAKTGKVPMPKESSEQRVGGHAMALVGYDDSIQSFIVANQWGKSWGDSGYCYIPYALILNKKLTGDLWTVRGYDVGKEKEPLPIPTPIPVPATVEWKVNQQYKKGDLITYSGVVYRCSISHKSISVWTPIAVPALWTKV